MIARGDRLAEIMSAYLVARIEAHPLIEVRLGTQVAGLRAENGHLAEVDITGPAGREETLRVTTLFICIGGQPHSEWCAAEGVGQTPGYILTGLDLLDSGRRPAAWPLDRDPLPLETSRPCVFAAGDVRYGSTKCVAGAVGDGAMAVAPPTDAWSREQPTTSQPRRAGTSNSTPSLHGPEVWRRSVSECLAVIDFLDARLEPLDRRLKPFAHADPRAVLLEARTTPVPKRCEHQPVHARPRAGHSSASEFFGLRLFRARAAPARARASTSVPGW